MTGIIRIVIIVFLIVPLWACEDNASPTLEERPDVMPATQAMDSDVINMPPEDDVSPPMLDMETEIVDLGPPRDAALVPNPVVRVETTLSELETAAGESITVDCVALDAQDELIEDAITRVQIRPLEGWAEDRETDGIFTGQRVGEYTVTCREVRSRITDTSPETWVVRAGPVSQTRAYLDANVIVAGGEVNGWCEAADAYGNEIEPSDAAIELTSGVPDLVVIEDGTVSSGRAGRYRLSCPSEGAIATPSFLDVTPGQPARLLVNPQPELDVYPVGTVLEVSATAVDEFDNPVTNAVLEWSIAPELPTFGRGRFRLNAEGDYTVTVSVLGFEDLDQSISFAVDSDGPVIDCTSPGDAAMVRLNDGVILTGTVRDAHFVGLVEVDGVPVQLDRQSQFTQALNPQRGINVHTVTATDEFGNSSQIFCSYFAADDYLDPAASVANGIVIDLKGGAIDDGPGAQPIRSLADLFRVVLDSPALVQLLNASAQLRINQCVVDSFLGCIVRLTATVTGVELRGEKEVNLTLIDGGIRLRARFNSVRVNADVSRPGSTSGHLAVSFLEVAGDFRLNTVNDQPQLRLVPGSDSVRVGAVNPNFGGFLGGVIDLFQGLLEDTLRNQIAEAMRSFLVDSLESQISGALEGLDLAGLNFAIDVNGMNGQPVQAAISTSLTEMTATDDRLRVGLGTRATGPQRQARPTAGIPIFGNAQIPERNVVGTMGVSIQLAMVNQLMHALWRGNFFSLTPDDGLMGAEGIGFGFEVLVPPAVEGRPADPENGQAAGLQLYFGPARGQLTAPGLFDQPLSVLVAATLFVDAELSPEGEISFGGDGLEFEELRLLVEGVPMSPEDQVAIEADLGVIIRAMASQALGQAFPSLPVPDFAMPDSLQDFGLPPGVRLGIRSPDMEVRRSRIDIDGVFGQ